ncbi:unnamed protein product [Bursaphelenchus xylophilus]|uniref:(pine wood nematode) hypothetical protein n=1 Tax=Bursaphelenchus xylophilus TaxID=6326 RepID=A0A1I7SSU6_BURXY|nr:unnamed protein product [Bursaphelenchus xylophilus]CAG9108876.1 unnamed protein product [Bursaphelenchus xylophilus]
MAEKRKLINEMEKCFKKVDEGVELFQEIMDKMSEANSDNQREKLQDDLKKEIKKLQRLRDQIKGWQNSSDIKDKDKLLHYRKVIENKMETFKDVERENKTKPHSKQGLSAEEKLDPKEREKADTLDWLNCQIRKIQDVVDITESKIEAINSASDGGRKRGRKNDQNQEKEALAELNTKLDRVKYDLEMLELCMRLITNDKLNIKEVVNKLKEPLEMYVDSLDPDNDDDPTTLEPDDIYEELNLGAYSGLVGMPAIGEEEKGHKDHSMSPTHEERNQGGEKTRSKSISSTTAVPTTPTTPAASVSLSARVTRQSSGEPSVPASPPPPSQPSTTASTPASQKSATTKAWNNSKQFSGNSQPSYAATAAPPRAPSPVQRTNTVTPTGGSVGDAPRHSSSTPPVTYAAIAGKSAPDTSITPPGSVDFEMKIGDENKMKDDRINSDEISNVINSYTSQLGEFVKFDENSGVTNEPQTAIITPGDGACPLGKIDINEDLETQLALVNAAAAKKPTPMDSEKVRLHLPKVLCPPSGSFPQIMLQGSDTLEYFSKLSPEALFFTFYYMEGSKAQLLAAKALKKLSWRYHTKLLMWFQRHEEPVKITDDYEMGAYIYFDYERWSQRKKDTFTFEYRYLEDKDVE